MTMTQSVETARERFVRFQATGDRALRDELVVEHLGLAKALARRYAGRGEAMDDLQQVATVGLLKAVERFEPQRGLSFTTFAVPTITGEIKRHFRDRTWSTRVPRALQELALRLTDSVRELSQELGRSPSIAEIATRLEIDEELVLEAIEVSRSYTASSLDTPADDETGASRFDRVLGGDDRGFEAVDQRMTVDYLLSTLSERDRAIVTLRFFDNLTQSEIAARVGISQMHVSRLLARALEALHDVIAES
jgi:RNA polymerase sigma-B factor